MVTIGGHDGREGMQYVELCASGRIEYDGEDGDSPIDASDTRNRIPRFVPGTFEDG